MGPLQRTPGTAPTAFSQDPPWLRRRERSSLVKNRMREICTSGSVRDGDGNVPIYSAPNGAQWPQPGSEGGWRGQARQIAKEPELARLERRLEAGQEKPAVETRQHLYRQKEAGAAADPAGPVDRWPATRHDAVDMGMMMEVLSPGVQDGHQPDLGAEMPGIGSDDAQRLGGGREQDAIDDCLIVESDLCDWRRQRKDDVEVRHRQQLGLSVGQPFGTRQPLALRAVPVAAGIVGDAKPAAAVALFEMTAQRRRAAGFDGAHNTALAAAQMAGMGLTVGGTVAAEDIRHLQSAAHAKALRRAVSPRDANDREGWVCRR
jgi:hypothetical protein